MDFLVWVSNGLKGVFEGWNMLFGTLVVIGFYFGFRQYQNDKKREHELAHKEAALAAIDLTDWLTAHVVPSHILASAPIEAVRESNPEALVARLFVSTTLVPTLTVPSLRFDEVVGGRGFASVERVEAREFCDDAAARLSALSQPGASSKTEAAVAVEESDPMAKRLSAVIKALELTVANAGIIPAESSALDAGTAAERLSAILNAIELIAAKIERAPMDEDTAYEYCAPLYCGLVQYWAPMIALSWEPDPLYFGDGWRVYSRWADRMTKDKRAVSV